MNKIDLGKILIEISSGASFSFTGYSQLFRFPDKIRINSGKIYIISGDNGTGKTTLLNVLNGFIPPTEGEITYYKLKSNKQYIHSLKEYDNNYTPISIANLNNGIRRSFQFPRLSPELSIIDNISIGRRLFYLEKIGHFFKYFRINNYSNLSSSDLEYAELLLELFKIDNPKETPRLLSAGQRKIISILRSIYSQGTILLLDEPFSSVDRESTIKLVDLFINYINKKERAIIMVSHNQKIFRDMDAIIIRISDQRVKVYR